MTPNTAILATARGLMPRLRERAVDTERDRRVDPALMKTLASAGLLRMLVPREIGGLDVHPSTFVRVLAELARADAAAAWCVMTGATTAVLSAYLPRDGAAEIFADPDVILAGVFAPMGRAVREGDGYRLTGRWPFASGCQNSDWLMGGALVMSQDKDTGEHRPETDADGRPEVVSMFLPTAAATIHDTWSVSGLRGTGSHDIEVRDILVPEQHCARVVGHRPLVASVASRVPVFGVLAAGVAAVGLGIAQAAIDEFTDLVRRKRRPGGKTLAESEHINIQVANMAGELAAGRAVLVQALERASEQLGADSSPRPRPGAEADGAEADGADAGDASLESRAHIRLAACQATRAAVRAVDAAYTAGGGDALYDRSPLSRHFRDIHTVTQHVMVSTVSQRMIGRALLGLGGDYSQL